MRSPRLAAVLALTLLCSGAARADVLYLEGGRRIVGRVTELGDEVRIEIPGGALTVSRERVIAIERSELPAERVARLEATMARSGTDAEALLALADDARAAGLAEATGRILGRALEHAPNSDLVRTAYRRWQVSEREFPADDLAAARLLEAHGGEARLLRTQHYRIAYDAPLDAVRVRAGMLEAAWTEFHEFAAQHGLATAVPDERLEALVFADHDRWATATGLAPDALAGIDGLYVGRSGRVLLYDTSTAPGARAALRDTDLRIDHAEALISRLAERRGELDVEGKRLAAEWSTPQVHAGLERSQRMRAAVEADLTRLREDREALVAYRTELVRARHVATLATTTHEACHQLAFATGVCKPQQPLWLIEGLATLFEPASAETFVVDGTNPARLRDVRAAWAEHRGGSLETLVSDLSMTPADERAHRGDAVLAYAEAWSLVHFLVVRHGPEFSAFLRAEPAQAGERSPTARLAAFRATFGPDLGALERAWRRHVERL